MSDRDLRALERRARAEPGDAEAQRAFAAELRRRGLNEAVARFLHALTIKLAEFNIARGNPASAVDVSPGGKKFIRVLVRGAAYCFIDTATGTILKPGTWKQPEPKRIPRGSIYNLDPLEGCGPYGVAYASHDLNHGWDGRPVAMPLGADPLGGDT